MPKEYIEVFERNLSMQLNDFRKLIIFKNGNKNTFSNLNQDKGFDNEFIAFADSLKSGVPAIPFKSIYETTKTSFKILESLKTNKLVII